MNKTPFEPKNAGSYIKTLNQTGFTTTYIDQICQEGIKFSKGKALPVIDIGCAFGLVTLPLLAQGNRVIANDTSSGHLDGLKQAVTDPLQLKNLQTSCGAFPGEVSFPEASFSAVISSWVIHFFSPPVLDEAARVLFKILEPGGKVFLSASSPYVKFLGGFIPKYEEAKVKGELYPGWVEDVSLYLEPRQTENLPKGTHFLDPEVLSRVFSSAGFEIEYAEFFFRDDCTEGMYLDGRENVGIIARKP